MNISSKAPKMSNYKKSSKAKLCNILFMEGNFKHKILAKSSADSLTASTVVISSSWGGHMPKNLTLNPCDRIAFTFYTYIIFRGV